MNQIVSILSAITTDMNLGIADRNKFIAVSLGYALGVQGMMPSAPTEQVSLYYVNNVAGGINTVLSQVNEAYVINTNVAADIAERTWRTRYRLLYPVANDLGMVMSSLPLANSPTFPAVYKSLFEQVDFSNNQQLFAMGRIFHVIQQINK